jgi:CHASE3 domain sensor protein
VSKPQWLWQDHYLEAFLETNSDNLVQRVEAAESAIYSRTKELGSTAETKPEWQAIADAMAGLAILKKEIKSQDGNGMPAGRSPRETMDANRLSRATRN